jgi:hypothetical protein
MSLKHLQHMQLVQLTTPIYFCNIHMEQLQHTSEMSKTFETYTCNIGEGSTYAGQFQLSGWEPTASGGARALVASSTSSAREHHRHRRNQHCAWVGWVGGACD